MNKKCFTKETILWQIWSVDLEAEYKDRCTNLSLKQIIHILNSWFNGSTN